MKWAWIKKCKKKKCGACGECGSLLSVDDVGSNEEDDYDYDTYGEGDDPMVPRAALLQEKASVQDPHDDEVENEVETEEAQTVLNEAHQVIQEQQGAEQVLQEKAIPRQEEVETKEAEEVLHEIASGGG